MRVSFRRILTAGVFFLVTIVVSVSGYMVSGADFLDALFMVVITIFSVGYEETIRVDTAPLKMFTILVIVFGTGSAFYIIGGFLQMATEGEIQRIMGARLKSRGIESLRNHAIVCGYGRMGQILSRELAHANYPFVIIDNSEERKAEAEEEGFLAIVGDANEDAVLKSAQIDKAKAVATVLPNDAMNVFITLSARSLNPDLNILARGELPATKPKLLQAGADHVVLPASIGGTRLAHLLVRPYSSVLFEEIGNIDHINEDLDKLGIEISEVVVQEDSSFVDKPIGKVEIEGEGAFLIVAIRRADGELIKRPTAEVVLESGDVVVVVGHGSGEPAFTMEKTPAREVVPEAKDADENLTP